MRESIEWSKCPETKVVKSVEVIENSTLGDLQVELAKKVWESVGWDAGLGVEPVKVLGDEGEYSPGIIDDSFDFI